MHIEANTLEPDFEKRKGFIVKSTGKETGGKTHTCVPDPGTWGSFKGVRETGWYVEALVGQVLLERFGGWPLWQRSVHTGSSWTMTLSF